jgi:CDP-glycerol glycerophosphotransferase (TagB/SpsB family)
MFHGVAGKWSRTYDRPVTSMRHWDRLFFINRRRRDNFVRAGAVDADSPAIRLVGMPKTDCLVDGSLRRDDVLAAYGLDPARPTVLYAPTWTPYSSLNAVGEALVRALAAAGVRVIVKLHENSRDLRHVNSGGVDWFARLAPILTPAGGHLVQGGDASPWMVAADVMITDHSSVGFEYLLRDRPLVRFEIPELISRTQIPPEYVALMEAASTTVRDIAGAVDAVERALGAPGTNSKARRAVADDLFIDPGHATANAVRELCAVMELEASGCGQTSGLAAGATRPWGSSDARVRADESPAL